MRFGTLAATTIMAVMAAAGASPALAAPADLPGAATIADQAPKTPMFDFRFRSLTATAPSTSIVANDGQLRHRMIGSMVDFFPLKSTGFFVSGGSQLAMRAKIVRDVNSSLTRLLYTPRTGGMRISNKFSPAATMGYVAGIGHMMELRLEGGALLGRMNPMSTGMVRSRGLHNVGLSEGGAHALNEVMRASFGLRF